MDISNVNAFFEKKGVLVASVNDVFEDVTGMKIPVCMEGMEIVSDVFIPSRVSEVRNKEDFEIFGREVSGDAMPIEESEHSDESEEFSSEMKENNEGETTRNAYEEKKKRKSEVKEFNRLRRASRISNKEKKKIFKKYIGKNHKKR